MPLRLYCKNIIYVVPKHTKRHLKDNNIENISLWGVYFPYYLKILLIFKGPTKFVSTPNPLWKFLYPAPRSTVHCDYFNVSYNEFLDISEGWLLVINMIPSPVTLFWHLVNQSVYITIPFIYWARDKKLQLPMQNPLFYTARIESQTSKKGRKCSNTRLLMLVTLHVHTCQPTALLWGVMTPQSN